MLADFKKVTQVWFWDMTHFIYIKTIIWPTLTSGYLTHKFLLRSHWFIDCCPESGSKLTRQEQSSQYGTLLQKQGGKIAQHNQHSTTSTFHDLVNIIPPFPQLFGGGIGWMAALHFRWPPFFGKYSKCGIFWWISLIFSIHGISASIFTWF